MVLKRLRKDIDIIDKNLVFLLAKRINLIKKVYEFKQKNKIKIFDKKREKQILTETIISAKKLKINPKLVSDVFKRILKESHNILRK
jgi:chorismate mutase/prephenate dehydrogenase